MPKSKLPFASFVCGTRMHCGQWSKGVGLWLITCGVLPVSSLTSRAKYNCMLLNYCVHKYSTPEVRKVKCQQFFFIVEFWDPVFCAGPCYIPLGSMLIFPRGFWFVDFKVLIQFLCTGDVINFSYRCWFLTYSVEKGTVWGGRGVEYEIYVFGTW